MVWHFFSPSSRSLWMVWGQSLFLLIFCARQSEIQKRVISGWIAEAAECDGWRGRENNAGEGENCKKRNRQRFFFMFGRWISFPFRGSIMDIFNAAQHALPLGPPALESFFFSSYSAFLVRPPSNLLLLINQEERKKWKMWCGSREENCNLVFVFPISSIQRNGQSESGQREIGWQLKRKMLWRREFDVWLQSVHLWGTAAGESSEDVNCGCTLPRGQEAISYKHV